MVIGQGTGIAILRNPWTILWQSKQLVDPKSLSFINVFAVSFGIFISRCCWFLGIITTEGALKTPMTYDNHPNQQVKKSSLGKILKNHCIFHQYFDNIINWVLNIIQIFVAKLKALQQICAPTAWTNDTIWAWICI